MLQDVYEIADHKAYYLTFSVSSLSLPSPLYFGSF